MKKGLIISGCILIVTVFVAVTIFVNSGSTPSEPAPEVNLRGTWRVYQYAENKVDNEYMMFGADVFSDFRDGNNEAYITSSYQFSDGILVMPEISKNFSLRTVSDNNIILVEPDTREWKLIKVSNGNMDFWEPKGADLTGDYLVSMVAGETRSNEEMVFSESSLTDYRDGELYISSDYELISGHVLRAVALSKDFYIYKNGDVLMMIEKDDGYVWELLAK